MWSTAGMVMVSMGLAWQDFMQRVMPIAKSAGILTLLYRPPPALLHPDQWQLWPFAGSSLTYRPCLEYTTSSLFPGQAFYYVREVDWRCIPYMDQSRLQDVGPNDKAAIQARGSTRSCGDSSYIPSHQKPQQVRELGRHRGQTRVDSPSLVTIHVVVIDYPAWREGRPNIPLPPRDFSTKCRDRRRPASCELEQVSSLSFNIVRTLN